MFSKNVMLFVATSIALTAPAAGQGRTVHLRPLAAKDIIKMESLGEDNVRFESGSQQVAFFAGCVAARNVEEVEALEPRDLLCPPESVDIPSEGFEPSHL